MLGMIITRHEQVMYVPVSDACDIEVHSTTGGPAMRSHPRPWQSRQSEPTVNVTACPRSCRNEWVLPAQPVAGEGMKSVLEGAGYWTS